jgi:hypothetical protein
MSRGSGAVALWALFLAALTAVLAGWTRDALQLALLGGAAALTLLVAALARRRRLEPALRRVPEASYASLATAVGLALLLVGAVFGLWLLLPAAGLVALALGALVRERRA